MSARADTHRLAIVADAPSTQATRGSRLSVSIPRRPAAMPIAVAGLTVAAFVLRFSQIHQGLFGDEVWTYQDIFGHSLGSMLRDVHAGAENSPPLFFVIAWISAKLGDPTVWIRLPSLLLGTATIPLVYLLGRETVGRVAGLIGAAVLAASPFALFYAVEARPYATMTFFVTLSTLALVKATRADSPRRWWVLYALSAAAAAYTHYTSIFVLAVLAVWSLWACRDRLREPLLANAGIAVLYLPWLPHVRGKALATIERLYPLNAHNVLTDLLRPIAGYPSGSVRGIPTIAGLIALGACVCLGLLAFAGRPRRLFAGPTKTPPDLPLITALAIATPIGLFLYSLLVTDLWLPRGLSASIPAAALLFGVLLAALPRTIRAVAIAVVAVTLIAGTIRATTPDYARPQFRPLAAYLDATAQPNVPIILYENPFSGPAITIMLHKPHRVLGASPAAWGAIPPGGTAYVVLDDAFAQLLKIKLPQHPPGVQLVGRRHYGSPATELLIYRRG